jgi:hypothetical protein
VAFDPLCSDDIDLFALVIFFSRWRTGMRVEREREDSTMLGVDGVEGIGFSDLALPMAKWRNERES